MEFENIVPIIRQWPFIDQWNITKEIIDQSDVEFFDVLYSCFMHFGSQDFVLCCRQDFPNDSFWRISTEFSRQKTLWLQDAVIQRRYNECNREPSAYLSNKEDTAQFPFMERQINREALRITRMGDRKSTSKSVRKKSAKQRKHLLLDILATINELSNTKKTLLIQYLAENFDKRLLYFTSVYLTSKKYIDFITLLPEPIVIKIISNIDPDTLERIGKVSKTWKQYSLSNQVWKQNVEKADFPLVIYPGSHRAPSSVIGSVSEPNWTEIYKINSILYKGWKSVTPLASTTHKQIEAFCCVTSTDLVVAAGGSSIRVWSGSGCDVNLEPDDIFSIGRKNVTTMLINDEKLIVACSDGNIRLFDLDNLGSITEPTETNKITSKSLTTLKNYDEGFICGDLDGYLMLLNSQFEVLVKRKVHKGPINAINITSTKESSVIVTGGADYFVRLISLEMQEDNEMDFVQFKSLNCRGQLIDARIIGNGGLLLATNTNVVLHHLVPERTAPLWDIPLKGAVTCLETVFETDLERGLVYIGTLSGKVYVCLLNSGQIVSKKQIHKGDIKFLHNMDNKLLISGDRSALTVQKFTIYI